MKNKNNYFLTLGLTMLFGVIGQPIAAASVSPASFDRDRAVAGFAQSSAGTEKKHIAMVETQGLDTVLDIPLRLGGFVATLVGTGFFIGTSPSIGLMKIKLAQVILKDFAKKTSS